MHRCHRRSSSLSSYTAMVLLSHSLYEVSTSTVQTSFHTCRLGQRFAQSTRRNLHCIYECSDANDSRAVSRISQCANALMLMTVALLLVNPKRLRRVECANGLLPVNDAVCRTSLSVVIKLDVVNAMPYT
jgi:hypothetical protein